ncbi:isoleucyl tRNA synthetase [Culex quinquefasciatus]|uniref:Isoleucyl tRNA synthetase n=1 Tax=Culex quinquefasciatus TaxID=7176 RepID=B0XFS3_CULQU|nr:isoleucyl tRNA synthetase [Culex quinquefasciatus]|eukprot:XP_001868495.1 isoleucyl tRNA synthetase [Culex quinquefasciatus]
MRQNKGKRKSSEDLVVTSVKRLNAKPANGNRKRKQPLLRSDSDSECRKGPAPIASPVAAKAKVPKESTKGKVLFVGNLKRTINVQQLAAKFSPFGTVTALRLVMDKETGLSKGFGNIQYFEAADAAKAMVQMNDLPGPNCTRLVLAADGQKMSKRKKNYPYPLEVHLKYGADELRLYLINSPVVRAENLHFKDIIKDVFLSWFNAFRFLLQNIDRFEKEDKIVYRYDAGRRASKSSTNESLLEFVVKEMKAYQLYTVVPRLTKFIDQLTDWYVHMNRKRIKGEFGVEDNYHELDTLYDVLMAMVQMMAPFTPYLTEFFFSVHVDGAQERLQVIKVVKVLTDPHIAKQLKLGFFTVLGHRIELTSRPADLAETHHGDARFGQANAAIQLVPRVHRSDQNLAFCWESMVVEMNLIMIGQYLLECHLASLYTIAIAKLIIRAAIFVT